MNDAERAESYFNASHGAFHAVREGRYADAIRAMRPIEQYWGRSDRLLEELLSDFRYEAEQADYDDNPEQRHAKAAELIAAGIAVAFKFGYPSHRGGAELEKLYKRIHKRTPNPCFGFHFRNGDLATVNGSAAPRPKRRKVKAKSNPKSSRAVLAKAMRG